MTSANGLLPIGCTCLIVRATVWHVCRDGHVSSRTGSCVSVFTHGNNGVCKVGHMSGEMGLSVSDCAHGLCACVQSRTHEWRDGLVFVRLCTRRVRLCAKSDTKTLKLGPACPFLHTACVRVCKVGHKNGETGLCVSVFAHGNNGVCAKSDTYALHLHS